MIIEESENSQNNIKSIVCMVNDAVQTSGDMNEMIVRILIIKNFNNIIKF